MSEKLQPTKFPYTLANGDVIDSLAHLESEASKLGLKPGFEGKTASAPAGSNVTQRRADLVARLWAYQTRLRKQAAADLEAAKERVAAG